MFWHQHLFIKLSVVSIAVGVVHTILIVLLFTVTHLIAVDIEEDLVMTAVENLSLLLIIYSSFYCTTQSCGLNFTKGKNSTDLL